MKTVVFILQGQDVAVKTLAPCVADYCINTSGLLLSDHVLCCVSMRLSVCFSLKLMQVSRNVSIYHRGC